MPEQTGALGALSGWVCFDCGWAARKDSDGWHDCPPLVAGVPRGVPESAVSPCGKTAAHVCHDWVEQTGSIDYEQYWCPGLTPARTEYGAGQ